MGLWFVEGPRFRPKAGGKPKRSVLKRAAAIEFGHEKRIDIRAAGLGEDEAPLGSEPSYSHHPVRITRTKRTAQGRSALHSTRVSLLRVRR